MNNDVIWIFIFTLNYYLANLYWIFQIFVEKHPIFFLWGLKNILLGLQSFCNGCIDCLHSLWLKTFGKPIICKYNHSFDNLMKVLCCDCLDSMDHIFRSLCRCFIRPLASSAASFCRSLLQQLESCTLDVEIRWLPWLFTNTIANAVLLSQHCYSVTLSITFSC